MAGKNGEGWLGEFPRLARQWRANGPMRREALGRRDGGAMRSAAKNHRRRGLGEGGEIAGGGRRRLAQLGGEEALDVAEGLQTGELFVGDGKLEHFFGEHHDLHHRMFKFNLV